MLSKSDLLDFIDDFDPGKAEQHLRELANPAPAMSLSARRAESLQPWLDWLRAQLQVHRGGALMLPARQSAGHAQHEVGQAS